MVALARGSVQIKDDQQDINQSMIVHCANDKIHAQTADSTTRFGTSSPVQNDVQEKLNEVLSKVADIATQVSQLRSESEGEAVKFFGLGFRDNREAEAWITTYMDDCSYGFIVDAHMVFEHVFSYVSESESTIKQLQGLNKLKIDNLTQSLAISSFETRIPKYFSKSASVAVSMLKKPSFSHFDQIPSYTEWNASTHGYRERLRDELKFFDMAHTKLIEQNLSDNQQAYNLAKLSMAESITWIFQLIMYLDDTYNDLVRQNTFNPDKAWQLTTQLGRRIFMEISVPRTGIQNVFKVGDNNAIGRQMFWPIIKSHELMKRYKDASFKDDPTIASEYVKFLAANSGNDHAEKLTSKINSLEIDIKAVSKSLNGLEKGNGQGLNKVDDIQKRLTKMHKRLVKLEGGKN
jgi:outer membrane murein-binding lipoprotein Lpp